MTTPQDPRQTSAEAAGSIRDRLSSPASTDQANSGGDSRHSSLSSADFRNTDSRAELRAQGLDEGQHMRSDTPPQPVDDLVSPRASDLSEADAKSAERKVSALFLLSFVSVIAFAVWFFVGEQAFEAPSSPYYTPLLGVFMGLALFGVGAGAVLWAKLLMVDEEAVQERHPFGSPADERTAAAAALKQGYTDAGLPRRNLLKGTLALGAGSLALLPIPLVFGLGRWQHKERELGTTEWREGIRLIRTNGTPIRLGDLTVGSVESAFPDVEHGTTSHDSALLLIRMRPDELKLEGEKAEWAYQGHVAYSSICTHLGCPVKLYESQTHHLLCPCHQSTFDASQGAKVIFGPAARNLPQLAISVDEEGYFIATGDFATPTGPSYWERS